MLWVGTLAKGEWDSIAGNHYLRNFL